MEERNDMDKIDDVMLPGFRFHPTDEELVDFYLRRKIQQKSLPIELIKQVDIYKYDPWDLPKLASTGEKEWYFYCPRDRKYRNSARPNRVTRAGFWKATGTDRPIYSSEGKCIGLKKSLVFYRGRAAKGIKTDWMMHEFRLPSTSDSAPPEKPSDIEAFPQVIFKKTNSMSMAQKALSHPWITQLPECMISDILTQGANCNQFSSDNISCTTEIGSAIQFRSNNQELHHQVSSANFSASDIPCYKPIKSSQVPVSNGDLADSFIFTTLEASGPAKCAVEASSVLFNAGCIGFEGPNQQFSGFSITLPHDIQGNMMSTASTTVADEQSWRKNPDATQLSNQWERGEAIGFPFSLPPLPWDSPPCSSEMSTNYFTNKCCT